VSGDVNVREKFGESFVLTDCSDADVGVEQVPLPAFVLPASTSRHPIALLVLNSWPAGVLASKRMAGVVAPFATEDDRRTLAQARIGLSPSGFTEFAAGLGSLNVPVRVSTARTTASCPTSPKPGPRLADDVPHAEATSIPGCGHFLQEEATEQVAGVLAPFFALDTEREA
jgi:pimeloyl-ACP methyl ester carboxylesterase